MELFTIAKAAEDSWWHKMTWTVVYKTNWGRKTFIIINTVITFDTEKLYSLQEE